MSDKKEKPQTAFDVENMFCKKIDIHTHIMPTRLSVEDRIWANELLGVSKCVLLTSAAESSSAIGGEPFTGDDAYEACLSYPDIFAWLCNMCPDGTEKTDAKLKKYHDMGASGVGEFACRLLFDSCQMERFFSCMEELGMVFLFHMAPQDSPKYYGIVDGPRLPGLESALKKHPNMIFIGHSQPFWFEISRTDETDPDVRNSFPQGRIRDGRITQLMREYPNLYCDLSANSGGNAMMRDPEFAFSFMEEFSDRLMFGTDWCGGPFRYGLSAWLDFMMMRGNISRETYMKICYENAERIFWRNK